jgi:hypothetical protein
MVSIFKVNKRTGVHLIHCWELPALNEVIHCRQGDTKVFRGLFDRHELRKRLVGKRLVGHTNEIRVKVILTKKTKGKYQNCVEVDI